jgi:hypothetical protein
MDLDDLDRLAETLRVKLAIEAHTLVGVEPRAVLATHVYQYALNE